MSDPHGHVPVMADEVMELLAPEAGDDMADLTLGAGGHAERILESTDPEGRLVGVDRDRHALAIARKRLARFGDRVVLVEGNYADVVERLEDHGFPRLSGALLDLGVSSMQLDDARRGFSIKGDGPLDMRMSEETVTRAEDIVNDTGVDELERIFREYGEEPRARAVAQKIVDVRRRTRITRTRELAELVRSVVKGGGKTHPATRVFQAIRIAVNGELESLERGLASTFARLAPGGRLVVITFHSLEDRIVKQFFRGRDGAGEGVLLTKKPRLPQPSETRSNPRSRSAKVRCLQRASES